MSANKTQKVPRNQAKMSDLLPLLRLREGDRVMLEGELNCLIVGKIGAELDIQLPITSGYYYRGNPVIRVKIGQHELSTEKHRHGYSLHCGVGPLKMPHGTTKVVPWQEPKFTPRRPAPRRVIHV